MACQRGRLAGVPAGDLDPHALPGEPDPRQRAERAAPDDLPPAVGRLDCGCGAGGASVRGALGDAQGGLRNVSKRGRAQLAADRAQDPRREARPACDGVPQGRGQVGRLLSHAPAPLGVVGHHPGGKVEPGKHSRELLESLFDGLLPAGICRLAGCAAAALLRFCTGHIRRGPRKPRATRCRTTDCGRKTTARMDSCQSQPAQTTRSTRSCRSALPPLAAESSTPCDAQRGRRARRQGEAARQRGPPKRG
mmetsp:Transcript_82672/g.246536  ORF Transcript_82672/g.246536 Transcript_82672/m.246536 type:complete len:250 (-) Transcript_82672:98-847(-)